MTRTVAYAEIVKHERDPETNDLIVWGRATSDDLDSDKQVCDPEWLKTAMPKWFEIGNVREQHSSIAAGVGTELKQSGNAWNLRTRVVDPNSALKVEKGVLKSYSIGISDARDIKDATAPGGRICGGSIVEVSLVDRPANPTCMLTITKAAKPGMSVIAGNLDSEHMLVKVEEMHFGPGDADAASPIELTIAGGSDAAVGAAVMKLVRDGTLSTKRDFTAAERQQAADTGDALPDGSYPIKTAADLRNAIDAYGRAKDPAAVKSHIERRAKALGKTDLLPESWKGKAAEPGQWAHDPSEIAAVRDGLVALINAELQQLCEGGDDLGDVSELLCALSMLMCWWGDEAREGEAPTPYPARVADPHASVINRMEAPVATIVGQGTAPESVQKTDTPDAAPAAVDAAAGKHEAPEATQTPAPAQPVADAAPADAEQAPADKAAIPEVPATPAAAPAGEQAAPAATTPPAPVDKAAAPEATPALTPEVVEALIAKAMAPLQADLAKAMAQPAPGGPVLARTVAEVDKASAREKQLADAAHYKRLAYEVDDFVARDGYLAKAAALTSAAATS